MIPLILRLKKKGHKELAKAEDLIVEELYKFFSNAVLHGGTAIWRCYNGNRFSEDIDVYIEKDIKKIDALFEALEKKGFSIQKKKIGEKSLFSVLQFNRQIVRLEAIFKKAGGFLAEYETVEGNFITVYALTPEELIKEKINAYLKRFKVRDLYDVFFLLRHVKDKNKILDELRKLLNNFKEPIDKTELKVLIIEGIVPGTEKIIEYIKHYAK
jgi:predicted nucleotidyltransferase component of viral defense system